MDKLNKQDVFNRVYKYYANGGKPGYDPRAAQCAYFASDGGHCAMGVVLDSLGFESKHLGIDALDGDVGDVLQDLGTKLTDNFEPDVYANDSDAISGKTFLARMQTAHDLSAADNFSYNYDEDGNDGNWSEDTRDDLVAAFETFAKDEGLTITNNE